MKIFKKAILTFTALMALSVAAQNESPKYIFYFIGDGMGMGPVMSALTYKRMVHPEQAPLTMTGFPVASFCQTFSASSPVTDSAAAGTALSTGSKTKNSMLGMNADTVSVTSIARFLKDDGWGIGILTSVAPDDATPGAFYAHVPARSMFYDIDIQAANSGYDFIAGSAWRGTSDKEGNPTDVMEVFENNGYKTFYGPEGMKEIKDVEKVVLLGNPDCNLNNNDISFTIDSVPCALRLPEMTEVALNHLLRVSPDRFFMMVEGGNIDHALHGNDGGAATKEVINFDQAIEVAYQFYKQHPDETLIIVTADHDTGGLTVGNKNIGYNFKPQFIDLQRTSKDKFNDYCNHLLAKSVNTPTWEDMKEYLTENLGLWTIVPVTEVQTQEMKAEFDKMLEKRGQDEKTLYATYNNFATVVFRIFNELAGFGYTTGSHTGNPVPVFAVGVGADSFKGINNNIDIPEILYNLTLRKN